MFALTTKLEAEISDAALLNDRMLVPDAPPIDTTFIALVESIDPFSGASVTMLEVAPLKSTRE